MRSHQRAVPALLAVLVLLLVSCSSTRATRTEGAAPTDPTSTSPLEQTSQAVEDTLKAAEPAGTEHLTFQFGPIDIQPGQNAIQYSNAKVPKPTEDGFILRIEPNIRREDGSVPPVDVIHLHHGVWLNFSHSDSTTPGLPERFFAAGEEKTTMELPTGFGYPFKAKDNWVINYMIHDLTPAPDKVFITYNIDFLPASAAAAASVRAARPIWLDVQNGSVYPVFDVLKGSGTNGTFTYPDQADAPYGTGRQLNAWPVDRDGILIGTAGHLHPGGLHDDLFLDRPGAPANGTAHLFSSVVHYFEPAGAVSWDAAMTATNPGWQVAVHPGDTLRLSTTYDTSKASWYESMGIMVVWMADGTDGADPFATPVDNLGSHLTHGHLAENDNHGGGAGAGSTDDPAKLGTVPAPAGGEVDINDFTYGSGDLTVQAPIPTVAQGQSLLFVNKDAPTGIGIWHSITACKAPCNQATGIAYPLADGDVTFDSGQLGQAGPPTAGRLDWPTPDNLPVGTYTYFCRIHPFMRGAFTVTAKG